MKFSTKKILIAILIFTALTRFIRIDYPKGYVFDEVYHAFTAKEYLAGHKEGWEWWNQPPPGVAYEWTHPPLAKEIMAASMYLLRSTDSWAWRTPGALFGIISVYLIYFLGKSLFKSEKVGLISAFIFSLEGLNLVQSRTGMNDIYFLTFALASLSFFIHKKLFWSAVFLGLSLSSKWTAIYLFGLYIILIFKYKQFKNILYFLVIPPIVYMITYIPFFTLGHTLSQFKELQQQMWWYHTGLKAHHDYSSPWWSWPLNLYPVWYYVDYAKDSKIGNIFASGNPVVFILGFVAILTLTIDTIKDFFTKAKHKVSNNKEAIFIVLLGFFAFWLPWALSPRIMFLYHYLPSTPFLALALGYQINDTMTKNKKLAVSLLILMLISFLLLYPLLTAIPLEKNQMQLFFKTNITKNPFGG